MADTVESYMKKGQALMDDAMEHLHNELVKIRAGKASPGMLNGIFIDYYGSQAPISQAANVTATDSRTLVVQPFDKSMLQTIERGLFEANLGITPQNDGEIIRMTIPPLTEERRHNLVKQAKVLGEEAKVSIRNTRHKMMEFIKTEVKEGYPEDAGKRKESEIEKLVHTYNDKIDKTLAAKDKDIMTV